MAVNVTRKLFASNHSIKKHIEITWGALTLFLLGFLSVVAVSTFWRSPFLLLILLLAIVALAFWLRKNPHDAWLFAIVSIWGVLAEMLAIRFGTRTYALPQFWGVPIWLPALWGMAALFIKQLSEITEHF